MKPPVSPHNVEGNNMIIVTGGAGMIGSNIVKALNDRGHTDILVVDNLKDGTKFANLVDLISSITWTRRVPDERDGGR